LTDVNIETPSGTMDAVLEIPSGAGLRLAVVVIHGAVGFRQAHREFARRMADNGCLRSHPT
jgi:carboxymethylenebutenolidase